MALLLLAQLILSGRTAFSDQSSTKTPLLRSYDVENSHEEIECVAISTDGRYIAVGTSPWDATGIYLFAKDSHTWLWKYPVSGYVTSVGISADGSYLVASLSDFPNSEIYLFARSSNTPLWNYSPKFGLGSIAISGDGNYIVFAESGGVLGETRKLYLFHKSSSTPLWTANIAAGGGANVSISADGNLIVVGGSQLYLFHKSSNNPLWTFRPSGAVENVSTSADGSYFAVGTIGQTPNVYLFHKSGNTPMWNYETSASVSITADGNYLSAASRSYSGGPKGFLLWHKDSHIPLWIHATSEAPADISISHSGNRIAGVESGAVYLFLEDSSEPVWIYRGDFERAIVAGNGNFMVAAERNRLFLFDTSFEVPSEVWVDDDYCDTCTNDGHTWGYDAFARIQQAVDVLWNGGTVHVAAGIYSEAAAYSSGGNDYSAVIINRDHVKLIGERRRTTIIDSDQNANRISITGKSCEVKGFTIQNSGPGYRGIYLTAPGSQIRGNTILNNGTGIELSQAGDSIVENNIIKFNDIGISNQYSHGNILSRNIITDNGTGIISDSDNTIVKNCVIARNGTGIRTQYNSGETFVNNTVADNDMGIDMFSSRSTIKNSIIWGNENGLNITSGDYSVTSCNVEGGWPGQGNTSLLPAFVNSAVGNYHLKDYSSCIGIGTPAGAPNTDIENKQRPNPPGSNPDVGAYEHSLAIPKVPPVTSLNIFGMELGNKWTYKGTRKGKPYTVEREITSIDQSSFPTTTYVMKIKENGNIAGTEWIENKGNLVYLWGVTYENEGENYTITFSKGLKAAWFPMQVSDHANSSAITHILGYPFNVSLTADVINKAIIALNFDTIEAYEVRYQLRLWGSGFDFSDRFSWWIAPYLGVVKEKSDDSVVELASFVIGGGTITQDSDSDDDNLADYSEIFAYHTLWQHDDTDGDCIPDGWEVAYGLDPLDDNDADGDIDLDGYTNLEEYLKDTHPGNPTSHPSRAMPWIPLLLLND
jgi:parallel beta-helix repeat protein